MIGTNSNNDNESKLLSRLRTAVNKVRFIITTLTTTSTSLPWRAISTIVQSSSAAAAKRRHQRFINRPPLAVGLTVICDDNSSSYEDEYSDIDVNGGYTDLFAAEDDPDGGGGGTRSNSWNSRPTSSPGSAASRVLLRTTSCPSSAKDVEEDQDVDRRAEMFIENFYQRLRYEKQISLELRYCKGGVSYDSSLSSNSYSSLNIISPVGR